MNMGHYHLAKQGNQRLSQEFIRNMRTGLQRTFEKAQSSPFLNGIPYIWCSNNLTVAMRFGQIRHVNVVAHGRAVRRGIVRAENRHVRHPAKTGRNDQGNEMAFRNMVLADLAVGVRAGRVEITKRHDDEVRVLPGEERGLELGQIVLDRDDGFAGHEPFEAFHNERLGLGVQGRGGLVEDQKRRVLQKRPGDGQTLALAAGQVGALLAKDGVVALGQADDEIMVSGSSSRTMAASLAKNFSTLAAPCHRTMWAGISLPISQARMAGWPAREATDSRTVFLMSSCTSH